MLSFGLAQHGAGYQTKVLAVFTLRYSRKLLLRLVDLSDG